MSQSTKLLTEISKASHAVDKVGVDGGAHFSQLHLLE